MRSSLARVAGLLVFLLVASPLSASAATQKEIDRAIKAGTEALKALYARGGGQGVGAPGVPLFNGPGANYGIGSTCLAGLALLETGSGPNDPAIKSITGMIRNAAYREGKTYQTALCLMYLDILADPADEPLIQILAARLLVGQRSTGGWGYDCVTSIPPDDERRLRAIKADHKPGKLHPEVEKYAQVLSANLNQLAAMGAAPGGDDNSNTQFGLLALWMARKHGVPVENALDRVEKRFMSTQDQRTGNWAYSGLLVANSSPAMYCAGLLGMATSVARREERRLKTNPAAGSKPRPPKETRANPTIRSTIRPPAKSHPRKKPQNARPMPATSLFSAPSRGWD